MALNEAATTNHQLLLFYELTEMGSYNEKALPFASNKPGKRGFSINSNLIEMNKEQHLVERGK